MLKQVKLTRLHRINRIVILIKIIPLRNSISDDKFKFNFKQTQ